MEDAEPNPVVDGELQGTTMRIVVLLLGLEEAVADIDEERVALAQERIHRVHA